MLMIILSSGYRYSLVSGKTELRQILATLPFTVQAGYYQKVSKHDEKYNIFVKVFPCISSQVHFIRKSSILGKNKKAIKIISFYRPQK